MTRIWKYIRPYGLFILGTLGIKLLGTAAELMIPWLMEYILAARDVGNILRYGALMILCVALCLTLNITANRMSARSSGKITQALRHDLFEKLLSLSARQMDSLTVSSAESRLTSDTYNINQLLARLQRVGVRAPIILVGGIAMMLTMDPGLALILAAILPIIGVIVWFVTKTSLPLYIRQQSVLDKMVRTMQENITGIRVIKALSKTDHERARFNSVNDELTAVDRRAGSVTAITNPATSLVLNLGLTLVVLLGAIRVRDGVSRPETILAFLQYFTMILNAMLGVTRIFVMWSKGEASARRVVDVLELPADLTVEEGEQTLNAPHIEFKNVTFSYTGRGNVVENLSFSLEKAQTLGILGSTGSGKSTILNLLLRLYDPDSGAVRIGGRDIRTIPADELKSKFGVVFQNDFVSGGTIRENIRFFRELDNSAVEKSAEFAQASEFIAEKEGGFDAETAVRGNNLSGGQKQRLLIARALAADPEILILDDASSALDYRTDAKLRKALRENFRDTTTVLVAQRVSSLRHADLILVLNDGKVLGMGTHAQLMASCAEYRIIAETQMGAEGEVDHG